MSIPDYQSILLPLLQLASDGEMHLLRSATDDLAERFKLTDAERKELLPSGRQSTFDNRVGWARTYLKKAGLLDLPKRGYFQITERGREVLSRNLQELSEKYLRQFPEFEEFRISKRTISDENESHSRNTIQTPEEQLETAYQELREDLAGEIALSIKGCSPKFFEQLVVDLLVNMGYGGSHKEAGQAIGRSNDEGIDGIIKEDRLGLDIIYLQAKRWENVVGRPEIQKFAGALQGQRARKGIFITTSSFTKEAKEYVSLIESKIILIDGNDLAEFMIDNGVGVTTHKVFEIKRIDNDYFEE